MKSILILTLGLSLVACNKTKEDVDNINKEFYSIKSEVESYEKRYQTLSDAVNELEIAKDHLEKLKSGKKPVYILLLKVHQSNLSLDMSRHIKNSMNASEFSICVSEDYYNMVSVGADLSDSFKIGSFIMSGKWGNIKVTVKGKEIKYQ